MKSAVLAGAHVAAIGHLYECTFDEKGSTGGTRDFAEYVTGFAIENLDVVDDGKRQTAVLSCRG
jgi:hypothetical protein